MALQSTLTLPFPPLKKEKKEKVDTQKRGWVGRICVEETVPDQYTSYKLESWHSMVRSMAFEELLHRIEPNKGFSMQCEVRHEWRDASNNPVGTASGSSKSLVVLCEINYLTEE